MSGVYVHARPYLPANFGGEAAALIGISDAYLRHLSLAGEAPEPGKTPAGRRFYSLERRWHTRTYRWLHTRANQNFIHRY